MDILDPLLPYTTTNRLYKANFALYKNLYFLYKRVNEKAEVNFLNKTVKSGMVVLDIGANIGFYTQIFSKLVGKEGRVYAFEPEKNNFRNLKRLCRDLNNVTLNNVAVGEKNGKIKLYLSEKLNVDHLTYDNKEQRRFVSTKLVTIDKYFDKGERIDFIKIDTQGFEYQVLLGMIKTLKRLTKVMILSEFSFYDLEKARAKGKEYIGLLKRLGFKISFLENDYKKRLYGKKQGRMSYVNLIAAKGY